MTPKRLERFQEVLKKRQNNITIVLENVFDPHNVAAVMRTCDAVGIPEIYILNTEQPLHENWSFQTSRSASKWVSAIQFSDRETCIEQVRKNYKSLLVANLSEESRSIYEVDFTGSIALVFGNEKYGVSTALQGLCDGSFIIPQAGMIQSLNISVACAVALYEAFRQKQIAGHYNNCSLPAEKYNAILAEWCTSYVDKNGE